MDVDKVIEFTEKQLFEIFVEVDLSQKKVSKEREYYDHLNKRLPSLCRLIADSNTTNNSE